MTATCKEQQKCDNNWTQWLHLKEIQAILLPGVRNARDVHIKYSVTIHSSYLAMLQWFTSKNLRAIHKTLFKPHISLQAALASLQRGSVPEESYAVWIHTEMKTERNGTPQPWVSVPSFTLVINKTWCCGSHSAPGLLPGGAAPTSVRRQWHSHPRVLPN